MDIEIANSLFGYFETLYKLNQKLIKLCGTDVIEKYEHSHKAILDIIQDIPRLIPYFYNKNSAKIILLTLIPISVKIILSPSSCNKPCVINF